MISYVKGTVAYIGNDCIVVDNNGIGYNIQVSPSTASAVVMEKEVKIYTYMNVKENELSLFGFLTKEELNMFNLLIGVNGVGPKSAVAMLGALSPAAALFWRNLALRCTNSIRLQTSAAAAHLPAWAMGCSHFRSTSYKTSKFP